MTTPQKRNAFYVILGIMCASKSIMIPNIKLVSFLLLIHIFPSLGKYEGCQLKIRENKRGAN